MDKKLTIVLVLVVVVVLGIIFWFGRPNEGNEGNVLSEKGTDLILYYGEGCPHCANVESFMKENNVLSKIKIEQKEVYYNQKNAEELRKRAEKCGLPTNSIGVPFLWDGKDCIIGDQPIIDFLKTKISQ